MSGIVRFGSLAAQQPAFPHFSHSAQTTPGSILGNVSSLLIVTRGRLPEENIFFFRSHTNMAGSLSWSQHHFRFLPFTSNTFSLILA